MTNLEILTTASVAVLRHYAQSDPQGFLSQTSPLDAINGMKTFASPVSLRFAPLSLGTGTDSDISNAKIIYQSLVGITPAQAADERLWVTLVVRDYWDYSRSRFPLSEAGLFGRKKQGDTRSVDERLAEAKRNWIVEHYFAGTPRVRLRGNAVARLWWMAHYANGFESYTQDQILQRLAGGSQDLIRTLVYDRPAISSSPNLASAVIQLLMEDDEFDGRTGEQRRHGFRAFVKDIDLLAGRRVLSFLSKDALVDELKPLYMRSMG
jgi:hypothetical protein